MTSRRQGANRAAGAAREGLGAAASNRSRAGRGAESGSSGLRALGPGLAAGAL